MKFESLPCVSCGKSMHFVRKISPRGLLPELETYECRECRLSITAEAVAEVFEMARTVAASA